MRIILLLLPVDSPCESQSIFYFNIYRHNMFFSIEFTEFVIRLKCTYNQIFFTTVKVNLSVINRKILPHTVHSIILSELNNPAALLHLNGSFIIYKKILNPVSLSCSHRSGCIQRNSIKLQTFIFN